MLVFLLLGIFPFLVEALTNNYSYHYQGRALSRPRVTTRKSFLPSPPGMMPSCISSDDDTYCDDDVDDYPMEQIRHLIMTNKYESDSTFVSDTEDIPPPEQIKKVVVNPYQMNATFVPKPAREYRQYRYFRIKRQAGTQSPTPSTTRSSLCKTKSQFTEPKAAVNHKGDWKYVVNLNGIGSKYRQLVKIEKCISKRCSGLCTVPEGFKSECRQQYVQKKLVAIDGTGNKLYTDLFWFPHCCSCELTQSGIF